MSLGTVLSGTQNLLIGGSKTTADQLQLYVYDAGLASQPEIVSYTVASGDTLATIATGLANAIANDSNLKNIGVAATASSTIVTITSSSVNATSYVPAKATTVTETMTMGLPVNGTVTAVIGGTGKTGDTVSISIYDVGLTPNPTTVTHTSTTGDSPATIAQDLMTKINAVTNMAATNPAYPASPSVLNITSASNNLTTYTVSITGSGPTETIALAPTTGVTKGTFNNLNQLTAIAGGGAVRFQGTTDRPVQPVTMNSGVVNATMFSSQSFQANPVLTTGTNAETVSATSGGGTNTTNTYEISVPTATSQSLSYDSDGNMTNVSAGVYPQYSYDVENRLIKISYDGTGNNYTTLAYDPLGRFAEIVETTSGSITSTKQFVWCGNAQCEERNAGSALTKQFFALGQRDSVNGLNYFYTVDHPGSVREVTNSSGTLQSEFSYGPYGEPTLVSGVGITPDFGYAGMYVHERSGLNLTKFRAYSAILGRWLSRDPLNGTNLYVYAGNEPITSFDPLGLRSITAEEQSFLDSLFGDCLKGSTISVELQPLNDRSFSPGFDHIYMAKDAFRDADPDKPLRLNDPIVRGQFAHEGLHQVQARGGINVLGEGAALLYESWFGEDPYEYRSSADPILNQTFFFYGSIEQQGQMIEDFVRTNGQRGGNFSKILDTIRKTCKCRTQK